MARAGDIRAIEARGLNRTKSAEYFGVSVSLFDQMVDNGLAPKPKRINRRLVWDRWQLDEAFAALPQEDESEYNA